MRKIKDEVDADMLLEIWEGKSMDDIAGALWDCFGASWCAEEFEFINRELVAEGIDTYEEVVCRKFDDFAEICEYSSADSIFQHLSLDEKLEMLEYYGYEDDVKEEDDDEEFEQIFKNDSFDIYVDNDSSLGKLLKVNEVPYKNLAYLELEYFEIPNYSSDLGTFCSALSGKLDKDAADALTMYLIEYMRTDCNFDLAQEINDYEKSTKEGENDFYVTTSEYLEDEFGIDIDWFTSEYYTKK